MRATRPGLGRVGCLVVAWGAILGEQFWLAMGFELLFLGIVLMTDHQALKTSHQQRQLTWNVASDVLSALKSGYGLMDALNHLACSREAAVAELGRLFQAVFGQGVHDPTVIEYYSKWRSNSSLNQLVSYLFSFLKSGGNPIPWLERSRAFMRKKLEFRKMLQVKTTQIKMQMVILTVFSWMVVAAMFLLFPRAASEIRKTDLTMRLLVIGLAFQIFGITYLRRILFRMVPEDI